MWNLNLLVLRCRELDACRSFYEALGLRFQKHAHGKGPEHYSAEDAGGGVLELYPADPARSADDAGLGFLVGDLEDAARQFAARGFIAGPIRENPWGRTFVIRDPDGRRVEISESRAAD
jgi:catechol 2,3-dioxygenase-like lactoylglutathione lyase family enzyme